MEGTPFRSC
uniref:Uncharacterized protein n=1 Tax=Arundo donax TaxID=35708 RepID=A0A0A9F5B2_ARUDO